MTRNGAQTPSRDRSASASLPRSQMHRRVVDPSLEAKCHQLSKTSLSLSGATSNSSSLLAASTPQKPNCVPLWTEAEYKFLVSLGLEAPPKSAKVQTTARSLNLSLASDFPAAGIVECRGELLSHLSPAFGGLRPWCCWEGIATLYNRELKRYFSGCECTQKNRPVVQVKTDFSSVTALDCRAKDFTGWLTGDLLCHWMTVAATTTHAAGTPLICTVSLSSSKNAHRHPTDVIQASHEQRHARSQSSHAHTGETSRMTEQQFQEVDLKSTLFQYKALQHVWRTGTLPERWWLHSKKPAESVRSVKATAADSLDATRSPLISTAVGKGTPTTPSSRSPSASTSTVFVAKEKQVTTASQSQPATASRKRPRHSSVAPSESRESVAALQSPARTPVSLRASSTGTRKLLQTPPQPPTTTKVQTRSRSPLREGKRSPSVSKAVTSISKSPSVVLSPTPTPTVSSAAQSSSLTNSESSVNELTQHPLMQLFLGLRRPKKREKARGAKTAPQASASLEVDPKGTPPSAMTPLQREGLSARLALLQRTELSRDRRIRRLVF